MISYIDVSCHNFKVDGQSVLIFYFISYSKAVYSKYLYQNVETASFWY